MLNYILRRLLLMIPTVVGITLLVFLVMAMAPGGVAGALLSASGNMRQEERRARMEYLNKRYGLDKPVFVQYGRWLNRVSPIGFRTRTDEDPKVIAAAKELATKLANLPPGSKKPTQGVSAGDVDFRHPQIKWPDLGQSFLRNRPVAAIVREALPITLLLNFLTIPIAYAIAVTAGIYSARHRGKLLDQATGTTFLALWSVPTMWTGVMAIGFLANKDHLSWFPTGGLHDITSDRMAFFPHSAAGGGATRGWLWDSVWHLVLPVACLTYGEFAFLSKLMRSSMLENLAADFARTARAKGLSENVVVFRHVLSNSILPLITVAAATIPSLLGGAVVIESIFSINGMGRLMIEAIFTREQEIVLSVTLVVSIVTVVSLLLADICYAVADPRITYS